MASVSVVVPTFRRQKELAEAIASALAQAETRELIVVDDCPDGSAQAVVGACRDSRLRYVRNPVSSGRRPGLVRNLGWPLASGELLHFLDDDDRVADGYYAAALAALHENPRAGVVFGRVAPFAGDGASVPSEQAYFDEARAWARRWAWPGRSWALAARQYFGRTVLVCGAALIRRDCVLALGGFDPQLAVMEDVAFYARAIRRHGAIYLDRPALHYRIGPSLMRQPDIDALVAASFRRIHAACRTEHGAFDSWAMKLAARTVLAVG